MSVPSIPDFRETEANVFAVCLLMPESAVREWIDKHGPLDFTDDRPLKAMAKKFGVTMTAAAYRCSMLRLLYK